MESLYRWNSPARFWGLESEVPSEVWRAAAAAAADLLPAGGEILARHGWDGLMEHVLGEGQFGRQRFSLSRAKRLYYGLKPFLPRPAVLAARRRFRARQLRAFPLGWPIEDRYVRFLVRVWEQVGGGGGGLDPAGPPGGAPDGTPGPTRAGPPRRAFWPGDARFAFVLTHDVESRAGHAAVRQLADLDERYGFRSSFNFSPEEYPVDATLLAELRRRGFEVGVHGLKHDARLFWSRPAFERRVGAINRYLREWQAVGFRAPYTHRHAEWMQALEIEYDSTFFDTDPFEPMPGGTMSIWPFFCGRFVELPCTLAQDHTLLVLLGERTPRLWLEKVAFIAGCGGMALLNVHPDYVRDPSRRAVYEELLRRMAEWGAAGAVPGGGPHEAPYWRALPREVARWWRARAEGLADSAAAPRESRAADGAGEER